MPRHFICFGLILGGMVAFFLTAQAEASPIRIGVLPIVESLPFFVAQEKGLFQASGVKVEIVSFASALERDSALQAGSIHGAIQDLLGMCLFKSRDLPYRIVTNITLPTSKKDLFVVLASPGSGLKTIEDLRGNEIGLSSYTVAEYVTDSLLGQRGVRIDEVKKVEVKKIPLRFQMLMEGKLKAATLPEPLASLALFQGARKLGGDYGLKGTQVVLVFQDPLIRSERELLVRFGKAYAQAVRMINEDPLRWRELLVEKGRLPAPIKEIYEMNPFSEISLPQPDEIQAVRTWMEGKGLDTSKVSSPLLVNDLWVHGVR
ncbi:MAG: MetQ/NlpA family ABC transporter substrate-binding protein [Desulfobacterota bacterium]|nr:MetQ/NlpA family ABC transporter substrate-binding protein [Thermodesulfobacteriota bacterium]